TPIIDDTVDESFIDDLMTSMTLEEKVGQMIQAEHNYITEEQITAYNIGSVLSGGGSYPNQFDDSVDTWYQLVSDFQDAALASSSEIPLLFAIDAVHGHNNVYGATIFPHNINLGMTRNPDLVKAIGEATAKEVKVTGMHWNFSPAVSVARDIRWGRTYESFSENPEVHDALVASYIEGLMHEDMIATAKHFVADGGTNSGIDQGNATLTEADIRNIHLPPFIDAIDAGVQSVMISFSSINDMKMHASHYWVTEVLKEELGFDGIIVSDWNATFQLDGDFRTQVTTAINAGVDVLMLPMDWQLAYNDIILSVNQGDIAMSRIDDAVKRILTVKYNNNLFEDPYARLNASDHFNTEDHQALAKQAAVESFVLLKNESGLPLTDDLDVYITGPASDHVGYLSGGWTTNWQGNENSDIGVGRSILAAVQARLDNAAGNLVNNMNDADVVVVVFTEVPYAEGFGDTDNPSLFEGLAHPDNIAAYQEALNAKSEGKTVIGIVASGRPVILGDTLDTFDAFFAIFLPGSMGGDAVNDVLYGDAQFTGKLSFTWPKNTDYFNDKTNTSNILFPFGYGLSYLSENE
ncbi:MAG: glycoside hydrolase family 3 protein, partial [Bacillota bacterium]